jgi:hypothetical protein
VEENVMVLVICLVDGLNWFTILSDWCNAMVGQFKFMFALV